MARLTFLGAAKTVTGSQYVVDAGTSRVMVDCGMFQGAKALRLRNWADPVSDPSSVSALILTHTHLDHIGRVPRLVSRGFRGPIFCTPPTRELAEILLKDAAHLQKEDAKYFNRKGLTKHRPALPLFDESDVAASLALFEAVPFGQSLQINQTFSFRFRNAGHLLGAGSVDLTIRERKRETRLVFSGDLGRQQAVLAPRPDTFPAADFLVVESTYGNRAHSEVSALDQLEGALRRTFERGGVLLVPAFAVGRSQQIVFLMHRLVTEGRLRAFPIHLDSPMAIDVTRIYASFPDAHRVNLDGIGGRSILYNKWVHLHRTAAESKKLNEIAGPAVIISSSGMLSGGRILHHCRVRLPKPQNTLLMTGYQAVGTLGRALADGAKVVRIHKGEVPVLAEVASLKGLSGHADGREIVQWLAAAPAPPRRVFVTHGEEEAAHAMAARITRLTGFKAHVPAMGETVNLARIRRGGH